MSKGPKDSTVGPWARTKLDALGRYLDFYTKVLKNQSWCRGTIFVDAFAGSGLAAIRCDRFSEGQFSYRLDLEVAECEDTIEFLRGSPRVALDIPNPFSQYIFIELDANRAIELQAMKNEYGSTRNISIIRGDANEELSNFVEEYFPLNAGRRYPYRSFVFLDPYGMQLQWDAIKKLAETKAIEVIINFPFGMAVNRLLTKSGKIPEEWQMSLTKFFGTDEWKEICYYDGRDLFGQFTQKTPNAGLRLLEWYRGRLKRMFGHVSPALLIKNTRGSDLYYLVWAGPHKKGLEGAEYIFAMGERISAKEM